AGGGGSGHRAATARTEDDGITFRRRPWLAVERQQPRVRKGVSRTQWVDDGARAGIRRLPLPAPLLLRHRPPRPAADPVGVAPVVPLAAPRQADRRRAPRFRRKRRRHPTALGDAPPIQGAEELHASP